MPYLASAFLPSSSSSSTRGPDTGQSTLKMQLPLETEALVVHAPGADFAMTPIVIQDLRPDELLVEIKYSGICHTDIWLQSGAAGPLVEFPAIPGHEGAGIIRAIGSEVKDKTLRVGDRVLLSFTACGECTPCREEQFSRCADFARLNLTGLRRPDGTTPAALRDDGRPVRSQFFGQSSFSRFSAVHEHCVVRYPFPKEEEEEEEEEDTLAIYAPMGCGYQTGAGTILNIMRPRPDQTVAVFGAGSVGFAAIMAAAAVSVKQVIAVDLVERKLELAKEMGATDAINTAALQKGTVVDEIRRLTGGRGVDFAIDTTGVPSVVEKMLDCLAYGGTAASIGATPMEARISVDVGAFFANKKTWIGVAEGDSHPPKFIPELIDLHKRGKFPVERISKVYPVADLKKAISDMKDGTVIKPIIRF